MKVQANACQPLREGPGLSRMKRTAVVLALLVVLVGLVVLAVAGFWPGDEAVPSAAKWQGVIVDEDGQPIEGAIVAQGRQRTTTVGDGRFDLAGGNGPIHATMRRRRA